jgi:hypothetical protein
MSFDNVHPNRKDWRKPYHGSKRFDRSCRCGGNCGWCEGNRTIRDKKLRQIVEEQCSSRTTTSRDDS